MTYYQEADAELQKTYTLANGVESIENIKHNAPYLSRYLGKYFAVGESFDFAMVTWKRTKPQNLSFSETKVNVKDL